MPITFQEAKLLLADCQRSELRDHAFGDREVYFVNAVGDTVAEGYSGSSGSSLHVSGTEFVGKQADELLTLGHQGSVERNDSTGPDEYHEGECLPGLTTEGVLDELVNKT